LGYIDGCRFNDGDCHDQAVDGHSLPLSGQTCLWSGSVDGHNFSIVSSVWYHSRLVVISGDIL
jgi:hypothetical protein